MTRINVLPSFKCFIVLNVGVDSGYKTMQEYMTYTVSLKMCSKGEQSLNIINQEALSEE